MVLASCRAGIIGAFPAANARSIGILDEWLTQLDEGLAPHHAPYAVNLIVRHADLAAQIACVRRHRCKLVISSVGSPSALVAPMHEADCLVFADVASLDHARKAIAAGADGLILLSAGAGGQTGHLNGLAFVRAVRAIYDGPIVLAGGIADGAALLAAQAAGCDLGYMGTRLIPARESMAPQAYKDMIASCDLDDVMLTSVVTGLETSILRPSLIAAGVDPSALQSTVGMLDPPGLYSTASADGPEDARPWRDIWSAGHTVSMAGGVQDMGAIISDIAEEYGAARKLLDRTLARQDMVTGGHLR